jgi:hypothetical protein
MKLGHALPVVRREKEMGLRNLFQRKAATTAPKVSAPEASAAPDEPLPPELPEDLRCAWDELAEAAKHSKVTSFHACTRTGRSWAEDPAAVRAIAATLREFPDTDRRQTT